MSKKGISISGIGVALLLIGLLVGAIIGVAIRQPTLNDLRSEVEGLQNKVNNLEGQVKSLEEEKEMLKDEADRLRSENEDLISQLEKLQSEKRLLEDKLNQFESQINQLQSQVKTLEGEKESLSQQLQEALEQQRMLSMIQEVMVKQEPGKLVYWVLPGPRRLSPSVFGTIDHPQFGSDRLLWAINEAKKLPYPLNNSVTKLLMDLPVLVAAPEKFRSVDENGNMIFTLPTGFSDMARIVSGSMSIVYIDKVPYDIPGPPIAAPDEVKANITFTDPSGNVYQVKVKHTLMPPIPGYETGGGVVVDTWLHGTTGTGTPLMPRVYVYAAFWAVGDLIMNGEIVEENIAIHVMTSQVVRDRDYRLVIDEELPLSPDNTPAGQIHHTHVFIMPIKVTKGGPVFHPLNTGFILPNGKPQPFIHVMFEQDEIVKGPFAEWSLKLGGMKESQGPESGPEQISVTVEAFEWGFDPATIIVEKGQKVVITFINKGTIPHNLYISGYEVKTPTIGPGESYKLVFIADKEGEFMFWCAVPGHREAGMEGKLIVESSS